MADMCQRYLAKRNLVGNYVLCPNRATETLNGKRMCGTHANQERRWQRERIFRASLNGREK